MSRSDYPPDSEIQDLLLVEDNLRDAQLIRRLLRRVTAIPYRITHVRTLADALLSAGELKPVVILANLHLPDSKGLETVAKLQSAFSSVPLVVITAWEYEATSLRSVNLGAQDYLVKGHINGQNLHRVIRYATERKRTELELERLAHYDQLTQLPNRSLLRDEIEQALQRAGRNRDRVAVLLLDLDRFKELNDTLGHEFGDKFLVHASAKLIEAVGEDATVARLGGDEFAIVIEEANDTKGVLTAVEKIHKAIETPVEIDGQEVSSSTSIGIAIFPDNGKDQSSLLRAADLAMYQAKSTGRNSYRFYADSMQEEAQSRMALEWSLRRAIEKSEYQLVYQPQLCLKTGDVIGVEALLRWNSPTRGLLSPVHFIGALEEFDLIVEVGEWVIDTACAQMLEWHRAGFDSMRVSVNVSAKQFEDPHFVEKLETLLNRNGFPPRLLELELTESLLMTDPEAMTNLLHRIRKTGVRISIDDFGTGYSSLAYLHEFPLNALKIDRTFVQGVEKGGRGSTISNLVISLGQNLDLEVVGEGVETDEQLEFLRAAGCDVAQGFLYARPMAADKLLPWLQTRHLPLDSQIRSTTAIKRETGS